MFSEEKKDSVKEEAKNQEPAAPEAEAPKEAAPLAEAAPSAAPAAAQDVQTPAPAEAEAPKKKENQLKSTAPTKPAECSACAKSLKHRNWYYREGAFYCTRRCYKKKLEEKAKAAQEKDKK